MPFTAGHYWRNVEFRWCRKHISPSCRCFSRWDAARRKSVWWQLIQQDETIANPQQHRSKPYKPLKSIQHGWNIVEAYLFVSPPLCSFHPWGLPFVPATHCFSLSWLVNICVWRPCWSTGLACTTSGTCRFPEWSWWFTSSWWWSLLATRLCLIYSWDREGLEAWKVREKPRNGLMLYTDFHHQVEGSWKQIFCLWVLHL